MRNPLPLPLKHAPTSYGCRKSSVNVHDAPPRDTTTPIMHDPPNNARTGPNRPSDHPIGDSAPRRNRLHNPQHDFYQFLSHSPTPLSLLTAPRPRPPPIPGTWQSDGEPPTTLTPPSSRILHTHEQARRPRADVYPKPGSSTIARTARRTAFGSTGTTARSVGSIRSKPASGPSAEESDPEKSATASSRGAAGSPTVGTPSALPT